VYGRRKRYIKIHFAVDIETLLGLVIDASRNRKVAEAFMDGAYDAERYGYKACN
jgi:hypothetical protein